MRTLKEHKQEEQLKASLSDLNKAIDNINRQLKSEQIESIYNDFLTDEDGIYLPLEMDELPF